MLLYGLLALKNIATGEVGQCLHDKIAARGKWKAVRGIASQTSRKNYNS
jgi:hypothetical protein